MATPLDEFERIARFFAPLAAPEGLGLVDDVAIIPGPAGYEYVLKTDAIVESVHYLPGDPPDQVAQKLLRVNLSDLAAKGAAPVGYLLMTALPKARDDAWLERFAQGLAADQKTYGIGLLGGDSVATPGPVTLSLTAIGRVKAGTAVLRRGARAGELVFVSGNIGDAALGVLAAKGQDLGVGPVDHAFLVYRYRLPQPRLNLGARLAGVASAMMDISDGLVADLGHLCDVSGVAAVIEAARVPLSLAAQAALAQEPARLQQISREAGVAVTAIGRIEAGRGVTVRDAAGAEIAVAVKGYEHF